MMRRFFTQSWGLLLIFAAWQLWVMSAHYNSIVAVSPIAVLRDLVLHPVLYLMPALWTLGFALSGLAAGLILGLLLAIWTDHVLLAFLPPETIALKLSTTPDLRILGFATAVSLLTGLLFGLVPALQSTKPDVAPVLKDTVGLNVTEKSWTPMRMSLNVTRPPSEMVGELLIVERLLVCPARP